MSSDATDNTMRAELLPCPFCGMKVGFLTRWSEICGEFWDYSNDDSHAVICDASQPDGLGGCGASGGYMPTEAAAIAAWNRRADSACQVAGWQPIETAPRDRTRILGFRDGKIGVAQNMDRDDGEAWTFAGATGHVEFFPEVKPTHWMPLPAAPKATEAKEGEG